MTPIRSARSARWVRRVGGLFTAAALAACAVTPPVPPPSLDPGASFKETGLWPAGAAITAATTTVPQDWWRVFDDPVLDALQRRLVVDNETLRQFVARVASARASLSATQAAQRPVLSANLTGSRSDNVTISRGGVSTSSGAPQNSVSLGASAAWEIDLWGRLQLSAQAAEASLRASESDLAAARLSAQASLVQIYFALRAAEVQQALLARTIAAYRRALDLTQSRYDAGVAPRTDVLQAQTQWRSAQAQHVDAGIQRAQLEHAIAVLVGRPPAALDLATHAALPDAPAVPPMLPSSLLARRPDIAAAHARVQAAFAQIGVAQAAFLPSLTLSANLGQRSTSIGQLLDLPNRFWSVGPSMALAVLDGGARRAATDQARAGADLSVAAWRQIVLTALQEVEDNLVVADRLREEAALLMQSRDAAQRAMEITTEQYRAGSVGYLNVVAAQAAVLASERSVTDVRVRTLQAVAQLLKNSGGGW